VTELIDLIIKELIAVHSSKEEGAGGSGVKIDLHSKKVGTRPPKG